MTVTSSPILKRTPQLGNEYALQGLAKASLIALGGKLAQVDVDPNAAFVVVTAADCKSVPAPGVKFNAGKLGQREFNDKNVVITGPPVTFTKDNIDQFNF